MIRTSIFAVLALLFHHYIDIAQGVNCASNPCNLVPGQYDVSNGYCCYDLPPTYTDALCTCPNGIQSVLNGPCRIGGTNPTATCSKLCVNGGRCNIVNGQEVCWCQLGFTGPNCELQGRPLRCAPGVCQAGTCVEQTIGASTHAYCQCIPGYRGINCNECYFTCQRQGVFPDTAHCAIGRYFYCPQVYATPVTAHCPEGQYFNRLTNQCDNTQRCI